MNDIKKTKKVFISYSWEPEEQAEFVLKIVKSLSSSSIEVVFDKYDLIAGNDTTSYMEQMVHDDTIDYVLLICSKTYSEKANKREGGVGIEGTIVSSEVYGNIKQSKYIPIVIERDEKGNAYKPTYLKTAFHIDLSQPDKYEDGIEQLVRHIYGKPRYVRPKLGSPPPYIESDEDYGFSCYAKLNAFKNAVYKQNPMCKKFLQDFQLGFIGDLEKLRIKKSDIVGLSDPEVIELVKKRINTSSAFTPVLEDLAEIIAYGHDLISEYAIFSFLEGILDHCVKVESELSLEFSNHIMYFDVYGITLYEMFLQLITALLQTQNYRLVLRLTRSQYQIKPYFNFKEGSNYPTAYAYTTFNYSLEVYNHNGEWRDRYRMHYSKFIEERLKKSNIQDIKETDFLLSIISWCLSKHNILNQKHWVDYINPKPPEYIRLLAMMKSEERFKKISPIFDVKNPEELTELLTGYSQRVLLNRNVYADYYHIKFCSIP